MSETNTNILVNISRHFCHWYFSMRTWATSDAGRYDSVMWRT